ncbi:hypothetical protein [Cutibacterium sp. V970]|uniref:hypothetical protein n=1 Tax=Cutibacterium sp. V970 TaxID=3446481 RepID=UPI003EDF13CC
MVSDYVVARSFNVLYIWIDVILLLAFLCILAWTRRRAALVVGLLGGLLYFVVDYGFFHMLLGTRSVVGMGVLSLEFWLSFSYGITNMAWMWLWFDEPDNRWEWSILFPAGWLTSALVSQGLGDTFHSVEIARHVGSYHGAIAAFALVGYGWLALHNLRHQDERYSIRSALTIGIGIQFTWEAVLMISGIRPLSWRPLVVDSLIETNLGAPFMLLIVRAWRVRHPREFSDPAPAHTGRSVIRQESI